MRPLCVTIAAALLAGGVLSASAQTITGGASPTGTGASEPIEKFGVGPAGRGNPAEERRDGRPGLEDWGGSPSPSDREPAPQGAHWR